MTSEYKRYPDKSGPSRHLFGWAFDRSITKLIVHMYVLPDGKIDFASFLEVMHDHNMKENATKEIVMAFKGITVLIVLL